MRSSSVDITIVVDNLTEPGLVAEHGFSLWIEADGRRILFDTGQGPALAPNAEALGVDTGRADALVLSHGHYDHTGGLPHVSAVAGDVAVYCHPAAVQPRYAIRNGRAASIQMPRAAMAALDRIDSTRLHWISRPLQLTDQIGLTGPVPRETDYEDVGGPFFLDPEGCRPDPIEDDLALWIHTDAGLVVCVGCCHAGLINTLRHVRRLAGEARIRAVIGGFHLHAAGPRRLIPTADELKAMDIERIVPCHCTGEAAMVFLAEALGSRVETGAAGRAYHF